MRLARRVGVLVTFFHRLKSVPDVGPIVAAAFVAAVDDVTRFPKADHLASYLGLTPGEHTTGGKQRFSGANGVATSDGDITFEDTFGAMAKTLGRAIGVEQAALDENIRTGETVLA